MNANVIQLLEDYRYFLKEGKIRANKVGGQWRILKSEVDKYLRGENK